MSELSEEASRIENRVESVNGTVDLNNICPHCWQETDLSKRHCKMCGERLDGDSDSLKAEVLNSFIAKYTNSDHIWEYLANKNPLPEGSEAYKEWNENFRELINVAHDDGDDAKGLARFKLAAMGIFYKEYEPREKIECEVCQDLYDADQTQEHHISYITNTTIDVCYSCHRRIHHEDGFFDELKPDISRKEAKKLKDSGYIEQKVGSN